MAKLIPPTEAAAFVNPHIYRERITKFHLLRHGYKNVSVCGRPYPATYPTDIPGDPKEGFYFVVKKIADLKAKEVCRACCGAMVVEES